MLQDLMAVAYTCRPQISQKEYAGGRDMPKHLTSAVKPLRTFLSFKDFNLLKSLAPSARPFFNFMTACYFPCLHITYFASTTQPVHTRQQCSNMGAWASQATVPFI